MGTNEFARTMITAAVLCASGAASIWLVRGAGTSLPSPGMVVAEEFQIAPVETARLASVLVAPGQRVAGGQEIARLDTTLIEREIAVAEARLHYQSMETDASTEALKSDGYQAERSFQADAAEAKRDLEAARAARAQQAAELVHLREELNRQQEFLRQGLVRRDRVDEINVRVRVLEQAEAEWPKREQSLLARKEAAEERLTSWRQRYSAESAQAKLAVRTRPLRQRVAEQVEALRVLRAKLESARVRAPANGVVVSLLCKQGNVVRAGEPFMVIHGDGPRSIVAYVQERDGRIPQPGDTAVVRRRREPPEQFGSKVVRVADAVTMLPARFWLTPQLASWGREVILESPGQAKLDAGEALEVVFRGEAR